MTTARATRRLLSVRPMVVVSILSVAFGIVGGILVAQSQKDYSAYTGSTVATVTDVVVERHSRPGQQSRTTDYDYYVDYEAEGETFSSESLSGVVGGRLHEGDTVTLVYPPGRPADAVTEATTSATAARVFLGVGSGLLVLAAAGITTVVMLARRRRARLADVG